jgi:S1-C subfamily serine protease
MKKILYGIIFILSFGANAQTVAPKGETVNVNNSNITTQISNSLTANERRVREASVRVVTPNGHGTGGLIKYKDIHLVLTAAHVADGVLGQTYLLASETEQKWGVLVYKDALNDIALLYMPEEFVYAQPMRWKPRTELIPVGQTITYSGYPSWHSLLSFRGHVAGFETHPESGRQIILQTYGWFGCSGSVIYDNDGKIIGILWAVDVERRPSLQVQENIVWVSPIQNLDIDLALTALCAGIPESPRACR